MTQLWMALVLALVTTSCNRARDRAFTGSFLGTPYEVSVFADAKTFPSAEIDKRLQETVHTAEVPFNTQDPESEVSKFNRSERLTWMPATRAMVHVVSQALEVARATNGTWDPTAGRLTEVYAKAGSKGPSNEAIMNARTKVGHWSLEARQDPLALKKSRRGLVLELTLLAQGYAVDEMADSLRRAGVSNFRVRIGSIVRANGTNSRGEIWPYAYQKPVVGAQTPLHLTQESIALDSRAVATFSLPDPKDRLVIDPRSGKPLQTDLLNVTVMDLSALKAAALAAGLFTVGKNEAMAVSRKNGIAAFFVAQSDDKGIAEATPLFPPALKVY